MALAAVCPQCSTRFRVVADQLKLRNGWVRCGSCSFAFNAVERLSYVSDDTIVTRRSALDELIAKTQQVQAPVPSTVPAPVPVPVPAPARAAAASPASLPAPAPVPPAAAPVAAPAAAAGARARDTSVVQAREDAAALAWPNLDQASAQDPGTAQAPKAQEPEEAPAVAAPPPAAAAATAKAPAVPAKARSDRRAPPKPSDTYELHTIIELAPHANGSDDAADASKFDPAKELAAEFLLRDAQAAQRERRINQAAAYGSLLMGLLLLGQLALSFRHELAALAPQTRPALQFACEHIGCTLELPAHPGRLSLESLQLAQIGSSDVYQATVLLKNTSTLTQRPPHLELTVTRVNGDILARRVLAPKEWLPARVNAEGLPAQGETVAQFALRVDNAGQGIGALSGWFGALFYATP